MARANNKTPVAVTPPDDTDVAAPATVEVIGTHYPSDVANAEQMAVRSRSGGVFWRGGCRFDADFTVIYRANLDNERDWMRIAAEPLLEVREVTLQAADFDADVPQ